MPSSSVPHTGLQSRPAMSFVIQCALNILSGYPAKVDISPGIMDASLI